MEKWVYIGQLQYYFIFFLLSFLLLALCMYALWIGEILVAYHDIYPLIFFCFHCVSFYVFWFCYNKIHVTLHQVPWHYVCSDSGNWIGLDCCLFKKVLKKAINFKFIIKYGAYDYLVQLQCFFIKRGTVWFFTFEPRSENLQ